MKFTIASIALSLLAFATAQDLGNIPACASTCVGDLNVAGCSQYDIGCICSNKGWISNLSCCISKNCNAADQTTTIAFAQKICSTAGVTVPTVASCDNSTSSSSNTTNSSNSTSASAASSSVKASSTSAGAAYTQYAGAGLGLAAAGLFAAIL